GGIAPLKGEKLAAYREHLGEWDVIEEHHLVRTFRLDDFTGALGFVNRVGELAERENHHPWIHFTWGKVRIEIWTHKIDGLTESDFILAAKISELTKQ
ncbi:MAG: 4a-hydroxytetrahydrobiopterin dehydratase, partial [Planctomycetota bacterium]